MFLTFYYLYYPPVFRHYEFIHPSYVQFSNTVNSEWDYNHIVAEQAWRKCCVTWWIICHAFPEICSSSFSVKLKSTVQYFLCPSLTFTMLGIHLSVAIYYTAKFTFFQRRIANFSFIRKRNIPLLVIWLPTILTPVPSFLHRSLVPFSSLYSSPSCCSFTTIHHSLEREKKNAPGLANQLLRSFYPPQAANHTGLLDNLGAVARETLVLIG